jgi:hypothetical protein
MNLGHDPGPQHIAGRRRSLHIRRRPPVVRGLSIVPIGYREIQRLWRET